MLKGKKSIAKNIGLDDKSVDEVHGLLSRHCANIHALYLQTVNFHWNMEDPRFFFLHELLDTQYHALVEDLDLVAETIRQSGRKAPASLQEFKKLMTLEDYTGTYTADEMIAALVNSYDYMLREFRKDIDRTADLGDIGSSDMLTELLRSFLKRAWFLRSHLAKG